MPRHAPRSHILLCFAAVGLFFAGCKKTLREEPRAPIEIEKIRQLRWTSAFGTAVLAPQPKLSSKWGEPAWILTQPSIGSDSRVDPRIWRTLLESLDACPHQSPPPASAHRFEIFYGTSPTPDLTLEAPIAQDSPQCAAAGRLLARIKDHASWRRFLSDERVIFWTERDVAKLTLRWGGKAVGPSPLWQHDEWKNELRGLLESAPCDDPPPATPPPRHARVFAWILTDSQGEIQTLKATLPAVGSKESRAVLLSDARPKVRFCLPVWRVQHWIDIIK